MGKTNGDKTNKVIRSAARWAQSVAALLLVVVVVAGLVWLLASSPPSLQPIVAGGIGFLASRVYEGWKESRTRLHPKKVEVYSGLLQPYREILFSSITKPGRQADGIPTKTIKQMTEVAFEAILYASDDVIRSYGVLRNLSSDSPAEGATVPMALGKLLKAMRKDLGHRYTSLDEIDILAMFVNMSSSERAMLKAALREPRTRRQ